MYDHYLFDEVLRNLMRAEYCRRTYGEAGRKTVAHCEAVADRLWKRLLEDIPGG